MSYLNDTLEPGDMYRNRYCGVKLPHDKDMKDPDKLAELSSEVKHIHIVSCAICDSEHELAIRPEDWRAWQDGMLIQNAMPYLTAGQRELLISQTCETCFTKMFEGMEDDE